MRDSLKRTIVRAVIAFPLAMAAFLVWTFRSKDPVAIARVKAFNRAWFNPLALRFAGHAGNTARLEHRGRKTGQIHATPVDAEPVAEGFLILMPYGPDVDWARNILHAGAGVLQARGVRYRIGNPRIFPFALAAAELPWSVRITARLFDVTTLFRVDVLPTLTADVPPPA